MISMISLISKFLDMLQKQVFVASCRPKLKASKEKTEEQLVKSPDVTTVAAVLQALMALMPCEFMLSIFTFQHFFDTKTIILWRTPFPHAAIPAFCFTFCKLFTFKTVH